MKTAYDLYASSSNDRCRFVLGRDGDRKIFVIGLNPSTATRDASDTTVAKVEEVARRIAASGRSVL